MALKVQLKSYLHSTQEDIRNLRSFQVMHSLAVLATGSGYSNTVYLARYCLLLLCKTLQNQAVLVKFSIVPYLENFHLFPLPEGPELDERIRWLSKFSKQCGNLALGGVINSLAILSMQYLKIAVSAQSRSRCLKALAYLYMTGLCSDERYSVEDVQLVTSYLSNAMEIRDVSYLRNALRAAGSFLMHQEHVDSCWGELVQKIVACQDQRLERADTQKLLNNDAKLTLTLADKCIIVLYKNTKKDE